MHCIIGVIHEKDLNVEEFCYRFLFDNEEYFEIEEEISFNELPEYINKEIETIESLKEQEWRKDFLKTLKEGTDKEKIDAYADYYGYDVDIENNRIYRMGNPYGECDWFTIGGRWSGGLKDLDGNSLNCIKVREINLSNPETLPCGLYGIIRQYNDEDWIDYDNISFNSEIEEAIQWSDIHDEELWMTLVDMHY